MLPYPPGSFPFRTVQAHGGGVRRELRGVAQPGLVGTDPCPYPSVEDPYGPLLSWVLTSHRTEPKAPAERDRFSDEEEKGWLV